MKTAVLFFMAVLAIAGAAEAEDAPGRELFSDSFEKPELGAAWKVVEGNWKVEEGALTGRGGGLIVLQTPPGGRFSMEFDIQFPNTWMSVIPCYTAPESYGTLYFGGGYWESFEMVGKDIADYRQRKDPQIVTTSGSHRIKVVSEYGLLSFTFDGHAKGPAAIAFRPGSRVAFRTLPGASVCKIKNFRLVQLSPDISQAVSQLTAAEVAKGIVFQDYRQSGKPGAADRLKVDLQSGDAALKYEFDSGKNFESCFVRLPVEAAQSRAIFLDVEGDGTRNDFFVIVHDASGEQHLVMSTGIAWSGWQDVGVNLGAFLKSPEQNERLVIHWGGDHNQRIDFPIRTLDIGVVKRGIRTADQGQFRFRNVRFVN